MPGPVGYTQQPYQNHSTAQQQGRFDPHALINYQNNLYMQNALPPQQNTFDPHALIDYYNNQRMQNTLPQQRPHQAPAFGTQPMNRATPPLFSSQPRPLAAWKADTQRGYEMGRAHNPYLHHVASPTNVDEDASRERIDEDERRSANAMKAGRRVVAFFEEQRLKNAVAGRPNEVVRIKPNKLMELLTDGSENDGRAAAGTETMAPDTTDHLLAQTEINIRHTLSNVPSQQGTGKAAEDTVLDTPTPSDFNHAAPHTSSGQSAGLKRSASLETMQRPRKSRRQTIKQSPNQPSPAHEAPTISANVPEQTTGTPQNFSELVVPGTSQFIYPPAVGPRNRRVPSSALASAVASRTPVPSPSSTQDMARTRMDASDDEVDDTSEVDLVSWLLGTTRLPPSLIALASRMQEIDSQAPKTQARVAFAMILVAGND
jgi:hypothetical protein